MTLDEIFKPSPAVPYEEIFGCDELTVEDLKPPGWPHKVMGIPHKAKCSKKPRTKVSKAVQPLTPSVGDSKASRPIPWCWRLKHVQAPISAMANHVLIWIAIYADAEGRSWPSVATLAQQTRRSERAVKKGLSELKRSKLIEVTSIRQHGRWGRNEYRLIFGGSMFHDGISTTDNTPSSPGAPNAPGPGAQHAHKQTITEQAIPEWEKKIEQHEDVPPSPPAISPDQNGPEKTGKPDPEKIASLSLEDQPPYCAAPPLAGAASVGGSAQAGPEFVLPPVLSEKAAVACWQAWTRHYHPQSKEANLKHRMKRADYNAVVAMFRHVPRNAIHEVLEDAFKYSIHPLSPTIVWETCGWYAGPKSKPKSKSGGVSSGGVKWFEPLSLGKVLTAEGKP